MAGRVLDKVLSGGKAVLTDGAILEADIGIADGRIAAIAAPETLTAEVAVDVKGLLIMPGIVDAHIHLGHGADISRPRISRDAETESAAAAAGGVTTFLSYVISGKPFEPARGIEQPQPLPDQRHVEHRWHGGHEDFVHRDVLDHEHAELHAGLVVAARSVAAATAKNATRAR